MDYDGNSGNQGGYQPVSFDDLNPSKKVERGQAIGQPQEMAATKYKLDDPSDHYASGQTASGPPSSFDTTASSLSASGNPVIGIPVSDNLQYPMGGVTASGPPQQPSSFGFISQGAGQSQYPSHGMVPQGNNNMVSYPPQGQQPQLQPQQWVQMPLGGGQVAAAAAQPKAESKETCCLFIEIKCGMNILCALAIIRAIFTVIGFLILYIVAAKKSTLILRYYMILSLFYAPELYIGYACCKWFAKDCYETREMVRKGFKIKCLMILLLEIFELVIQDQIFNMTVESYWQELKLAHDEGAPVPPMDQQAKWERIHDFDKKTRLEVRFWHAFSFLINLYYYWVSKRFAKMLDPSSSNANQR